ncbi:BTAD domain-containing putative transcriptional regulator [Kutzneria buriramensis]|uniref:DNA-binding SARP family transcriptional activator n=1 Tax=Kutzneria buriramensis TaxID=1045776 RepID=A0A3E0HI36_9PSEU|nr:BTAD domain-containing putative transcriptional regulator [Kutzneria buriramensis]REH46159.1 DNA-binding SARP family transcriptional activator [Kutzneria buriramensis]
MRPHESMGPIDEGRGARVAAVVRQDRSTNGGSSTNDAVRLSVLGTVRAWRGAVELNVGPPQQRAVLALLLANVGRPVSLDEIIDVLWGSDMPHTAANVIHRYVGMLRRVLEPDLPSRAPGHWLVRGGGGYMVRADPQAVDLLRFRDLFSFAREQLASNGAAAATEQFLRALALWHGPAASGIPAVARQHPAFAALDREHLAAIAEATDVALRCGMVARVMPALRRSAELNPLDEPLHARLVIALAESGRQAEALEVWQSMRLRLRDELGIDPGAELCAAQSRVLDGTLAPTPALPPAPNATATMTPMVRPAQLPAPPAVFAGRRSELADLLAQSAERTGVMAITTIGGMAGIGKTTLAVQLAHHMADRFPDGQLYVNLRGFGPSAVAMDPAEAVRGFLEALGVPHQRIPAGIDAQSALFRSVLSGRRVLVVLDNARDADQIRPLLPGALGCMTIVTSRDPLHNLVATDGAHPLCLDVLNDEEARELLALRLGRPRVSSEPLAVDEIVSLTGRLPLALSVVAARAAVNPTFALADVAGELRTAQGGLDGFASDIRAVFSWSYSALSPDAARLFRLLALHPGPDVSGKVAADIAGMGPTQARLVLAELSRAQLVGEHVPGRFLVHELLRAYAGELVRAQENVADRRAALQRMLDHYLRAAIEEQARFAPRRSAVGVAPPTAGPTSERSPLDWFGVERTVLEGIVRLAAAERFDAHVWQLVWRLEPFYESRGHWHDWAALQQTAVVAARRLADGPGLGQASRGLGRACLLLRRYDDALVHLSAALNEFVEHDDLHGQALTHHAIGLVLTRKGLHTEAIMRARTALELHRQVGDIIGQAQALNAIGWYESSRGNHRAALDSGERSLALFRELGEDTAQSHTWDTLGYAYHRLGNYRQATECLQNAILRHRVSGDRYHEAGSASRLGDNYADAGDRGAAQQQWRIALTTLAEFDPQWATELRDKLNSTAAPTAVA